MRSGVGILAIAISVLVSVQAAIRDSPQGRPATASPPWGGRCGLTSALSVAFIPPMTARIDVAPESDHEFRVTVTDGAGRTVHRVNVPAPYYEKLTGRRVAAKELVRLSFEFL